MIPKQAIEKAISGGWGNYRKEEADRGGYKIALDPSFWSALFGGATATWKYQASVFFKLIMDGKDTTEFWKGILK
jgi:hypothetical protein